MRILDTLIAIKRANEAQKENKLIRSNLVRLTDKHISRAKLLLDRNALLQALPKHAIVAEIGVAVGSFSEVILNITEPKKLHLIDLWKRDTSAHSKGISEWIGLLARSADTAYEAIKKRFSKEISADTVHLNRGYSWEVLETFDDDYFDWVYLDAGHDFESVRKDLSILKKKIKPEGIIAGHDYTRWGRFGLRFGVVEAVNQFCVENDFEIIYLTSESRTNISYAIRKLPS
ncbi:MAG: class I SAM-dependent methyltransferase [Opitutaceae bacterium]